MNSPCLLHRILVLLLSTASIAPSLPAAEALRWLDGRGLGVEGRGWTQTESFYDRLPASARETVPEAVWNLGHHSAGLVLHFVTDSPDLGVRWILRSGELAMPHMPATGVSGVDLYVKRPSGDWRWVANGRPTGRTNSALLATGLPREDRECLLYLPLYNGVESVELGIRPEARATPAGAWGPGVRRPVVFYGTSITQGGCASRPGMAHVAQLGRRFNHPTINLGFSGSGRMEPEMADLLAGLDPSVFVLDCLPNLNARQVAERTEPFVRRLRAARPGTPIVLVEDRNYADGFANPGRRATNEANHAALRAAYRRLLEAGVGHLHYLPADQLLGTDGEDTVDGSHPTDLGFVRHADAFATVLGPLLQKHP